MMANCYIHQKPTGLECSSTYYSARRCYYAVPPPHLLLFGFLNLNDTRTAELSAKGTDLSQGIRSNGVSP